LDLLKGTCIFILVKSTETVIFATKIKAAL